MNGWLTCSLGGMIDWLIGWVIDPMTVLSAPLTTRVCSFSLVGWLIDWLIDGLSDWSNDSAIHSFNNWGLFFFIGWLINWLIDWLSDWSNESAIMILEPINFIVWFLQRELDLSNNYVVDDSVLYSIGRNCIHLM